MSPQPRPWFLPRLDGLALRVATFLTIALLPLGLIALYQTGQSERASERRAELSLLALTEQAATGVQRAIEQALGTAQALDALSGLLDDPARCSDYLGRFVGRPDGYAFVGYLPPEGPVTCSSAPGPFEVDDRAAWMEAIEGRSIMVRARESGAVSGEDVLIVAVPFEAVPGHVALSIPRARLAVGAGVNVLRPIRLITFNASGEVLTSVSGADPDLPLESFLARDRPLASEARGTARLFEAQSAGGADRVYTVTPLIPDVAYAMAVWPGTPDGRGVARLAQWPLLFPLLMWATSLVVAFWAIHRLVIRRVTDLGSQMRRFGRDRTVDGGEVPDHVPYELREIEVAFRQMSSSILQDEARMENAFRERGVLLREVHHRVKNNLQLISSIISMQMRRTSDGQVRAILRRLQDRVLTLASIYRSLYTSPDMGDVNAAPVLRAIVEQELRSRPGVVEAVLDLDDMVLDPDKVVPLSFLAAEAVSNVLWHAGPPGVRIKLSVMLRHDDTRGTLLIANSRTGADPGPSGDSGQGIGQHLMRAFATQVGGALECSDDGGVFRLSVSFPIEETAPEQVLA